MTIAIVIAFYVFLEREVRAYLGFRLGRWGVSLLYPILAADRGLRGFGRCSPFGSEVAGASSGETAALELPEKRTP